MLLFIPLSTAPTFAIVKKPNVGISGEHAIHSAFFGYSTSWSKENMSVCPFFGVHQWLSIYLQMLPPSTWPLANNPSDRPKRHGLSRGYKILPGNKWSHGTLRRTCSPPKKTSRGFWNIQAHERPLIFFVVKSPQKQKAPQWLKLYLVVEPPIRKICSSNWNIFPK